MDLTVAICVLIEVARTMRIVHTMPLGVDLLVKSRGTCNQIVCLGSLLLGKRKLLHALGQISSENSKRERLGFISWTIQVLYVYEDTIVLILVEVAHLIMTK